MIPILGVMIGSYITTRMVSFLARKGERKESDIVQMVAAVTILVQIVGIILLFSAARAANITP